MGRNDLPVINIHMEVEEKELLRKEARKKGLQLIPFCRMLLLDYLKNCEVSK